MATFLILVRRHFCALCPPFRNWQISWIASETWPHYPAAELQRSWSAGNIFFRSRFVIGFHRRGVLVARGQMDVPGESGSHLCPQAQVRGIAPNIFRTRDEQTRATGRYEQNCWRDSLSYLRSNGALLLSTHKLGAACAVLHLQT